MDSSIQLRSKYVFNMSINTRQRYCHINQCKELRLQGQFFTRDSNAVFRNYCVAMARSKLQPGYTMRWQYLLRDLLIEKLPEY